MKTILYSFPLLMFLGFLVMSGLNAFKFISKAQEAGMSGKPFMVRQTQHSAMVSGFYFMLAVASLAILGLMPDIGADSLTVIGCFTLPSAPLGIIVAIGNYLRAKKSFELARRLTSNK